MAKYFYSFPKQASISSNDEANLHNTEYNYDNPLNRQRLNLEINRDQESSEPSFPYPSSFFPDIFFKNTVPHPFLIFYNLHLKDQQTEQGQENLAPNSKDSIIDQLNNYFGVHDILSYSSSKIDINQISETWNNRFPDAKSFSFSPVQSDFKIEGLQDLQSLHYLAFQLNTAFFLLFKIEKGSKTLYYNLKLGPDSSSYDIHFIVYENVDKKGVKHRVESNKNAPTSYVTIYNYNLWLSLKLVNISSVYKNEVNTFNNYNQLFNSNIERGVIFLEMEKRDPIPFIIFPQVGNFNQISFAYNEIAESQNYKGKISFENNSKNNKDLRIRVFAKKKYAVKINKIKSIATKIINPKSSKKNNCSNDLNFNNIFFAQTNRSAFLINEQNHNMDNLFSNIQVLPFPSIRDEEAKDQINACIISYRKRLKHPITYGEIASVNHPLISILCTNKVINFMIKGAKYLNAEKEKDKKEEEDNKEKKNVLKIVLIEKDKNIYYNHIDYEKCIPTNEIDDTMMIWKNLVDTYPPIMSPGANVVNKSYYASLIDKFKQEDNPFFSHFYASLIKLGNAVYWDFLKIVRTISERVINHIKLNKIGLNPIIAPIIYKEYIQICKTNCLYYLCSQHFKESVNVILMRDIQTVNEFKARITVDINPNEKAVEYNAKIGAYPAKKQEFIKMLQMKGNKQIPDPSFDFNDSKDQLLDAIILDSEKIPFVTFEPKYKYQFFPVIDNEIILISRFEIFSYYKLKYIYVTRGNVYSVGENENAEIAYGTCRAHDTEMKFEKPFKGEFAGAVYLEEKSCLIICYKKDNKFYFTGYDKKGQINESPIDFNDNVKSLVVISRTFFASFNGSDDVEKGVSVFEYNSNERIIKYNKYSEKWRIAENNFGIADIYKLYLQNEAGREKEGYQPSFIGSTSSTNSSMSTFCLYKYDYTNLLDQSNLHKISTLPTLNFSFESNDGSNYIQEEEDALLEKRIRNKKRTNVIPSMFNVLPIENDKKNYSQFDLYCTLCELFPIPIVINNSIITILNNSLSFYSCGYEIYRTITHQIYGFYINTKTRLSLFSIEFLLNAYKFKKNHIVLIVDTCGIGAKFSNMFYGTRFDEKDVLTDEIWAGFSYTNEASIILLLRINDFESLYNAVDIDGFDPIIFFCKKDGVKYSIKLGYNNELILNGNSSKPKYQNKEITFVNNTEFQNNVVQLKKQYSPLSAYENALDIVKTIIARYLTFHTFDNYPLQTIKKYATDKYEECYDIIRFLTEV